MALLLSLEIKEARNLTFVKEKTGLKNPYCKVRTSFSKEIVKTSQVSQTVYIPLLSNKGCIYLGLWEKERFWDSKFGRVELDISEYDFSKGQEYDMWMSLSFPKKKSNSSNTSSPKGELRVILSAKSFEDVKSINYQNGKGGVRERFSLQPLRKTSSTFSPKKRPYSCQLPPLPHVNDADQLIQVSIKPSSPSRSSSPSPKGHTPTLSPQHTPTQSRAHSRASSVNPTNNNNNNNNNNNTTPSPIIISPPPSPTQQKRGSSYITNIVLSNPVMSERFKIGKIKGKGSFSVVFEALDTFSNQLVAIKVIDKVVLPEADFVRLQREIEIMSNLDHRNIIKLIDRIDSPEFLFLILEYAPIGDLKNYIKGKGGYLNEESSAKIIAQVLSAVSYLHDGGVAHRDLKLENVLIFEENLSVVKIADFGLSKDLNQGLKTACGTPNYVAPEVIAALKGPMYSLKCDLWAIGVMAYILLAGVPPFHEKSPERLFQRILNVDYNFDDLIWQNVSSVAKDFIRGLLVISVDNRPSAVQALQHPWIKKYVERRFSHKFVPKTSTLIE